MNYTITITQTKEVKELKKDSYTTIDQKYISEEEYEAIPELDERKRYEKLANGQYRKAVYGYPQGVEISVNKEVKIFEQTVETLDIKSVIQAVNSGPEIPKAVSK